MYVLAEETQNNSKIFKCKATLFRNFQIDCPTGSVVEETDHWLLAVPILDVSGSFVSGY